LLIVHKDIIKYGAKKDRTQLESKIKEFQDIIKKGGNLLEFMKKTAVVEKGKEVKDLEELLWDKEQINQLKEGLKKYANIKEAKEKFKLISEMVGKP